MRADALDQRPPLPHLVLTDKGRAVLARAKKLVATKHEARLNELLGPANRAALLDMLAKIARSFEPVIPRASPSRRCEPGTSTDALQAPGSLSRLGERAPRPE